MVQWYLFGLACMILAALASILTKKSLFKEHATEFAASLALVNLILISPLLFRIDFFGISFKEYVIIFMIAFCSSLAYLLVVKGVRHLPISMSSPLLGLGPAITALFAFIFLHETLTIKHLLGLFCLVIGVIVLEHTRSDTLNKSYFMILKNNLNNKATKEILLALVIYSFSNVLNRYLLAPNKLNMSPIDYQAIVHVMVAIIFLIMISYFYSIKDVGTNLKKHWRIILVISIFTLGYRLSEAIAVSFEAGKVALVNAIKRGSVLLSTIIGGELFHEDNLLERIIATIIILMGIFLVII